VKEAYVCEKIGYEAGGARAALIVVNECYVIPIQVSVDVALEDIIWYMTEKYKDEFSSNYIGEKIKKENKKHKRKNEIKSVYYTSGNYSEKFRKLTMRYAERLGNYDRLGVGKSREDNAFVANSAGCWWSGAGKDTEVFPLKMDNKVFKVNFRFDDVWCDVRANYPEVAYIVAKDPVVLRGFYNDEAVAWLMWLCGAFNSMGPAALAICRLFGHNHVGLKRMNTLLKSIGAQRFEWGSMMCELTTLMGRLPGGLDPYADIVTRVDEAEFQREKAANCDKELLAQCISEVIDAEMATKPVWPTREDYWSRRWLYTKSGSHSRYAEKSWFGSRLDLPDRPTRRELAEVATENLVALGEPRVDAGYSEKQEHGKVRAIYSCDTRSYYTFDMLLRPVEASWRNHRVLLDPGRRLQSELYPSLAAHSGIRYMLDFDDFNSQHTLWAMAEVIRQSCKDAPEDVRDWAIRSWDNMWVHWSDGKEMREEHMVGTLPSGHRATTFVNTILNAAYCKYASRTRGRKIDSYHCGDDVIVFGAEDAVSEFVGDVTASPFRVNASKQSVGYSVGEFLRVAFTKEKACGYAARGVSSMVSGNWVTDNRLDKKSYVETLLRGMWTINSRFATRGLGVVAETSLKRRVPELAMLARRLVLHEISFEGSPVAITDGKSVVVVRATGGQAKVIYKGCGGTKATDDFMRNHIDYAMLAATDYTPGMLRRLMLRASEKPRDVGKETQMSYYIERSNEWYQTPLAHVVNITSRGSVGSVEAMNILQAMLTKVEWYKLVGQVRNVISSGFPSLGISPWPVVTSYSIPFSDCMTLRKRLTATTGLVTPFEVKV
jgi:hypothetical protein